MSCYQCAKKFGLFNKEIGCNNCGFGFCSKCCSHKIAVPKKGNKILSVCYKCSELLKKPESVSNNQANSVYSPPKNFLKLVESNQAKNPEPCKDNAIIAQRLEKLQKETKPAKVIPNEQELESRLNRLQVSNTQQNSQSNKPRSNLPIYDTENTPEDIIKRVFEEVGIEKEYGDFEKDEIEKLEKRLQNLKPNDKKEKNDNNETESNKKESNIYTDDESDDDEEEIDPETDKIMKKFLRDAEETHKKQVTEEDTWCSLCNNDSALKCFDCDDDFYCLRCYKQTHKSGEYKLHRTSVNTAPE